MKNITTSMIVGAALLTTAANADIVLTDDLSASGYIDTAYTYTDASDDLSGNVSEFELDFAFAPEGPWSAVSEISLTGDPSSLDAKFETVAITYAASDELSYTVGNVLSYQGFETFDATGLYQFSYQGAFGSPVYSAGYAFGGSVDYATDDYTVGFWLGESGDEASVEAMYKYTGVEDLTVAFIYANDPGYETINIWSSYMIGSTTFALEYTDNNWDGLSVDDNYLMGLVNFAIGDSAGITFRYTDGKTMGTDFKRYTISPSYTFSDNVVGLFEYSKDEFSGGGNDEQLALELLFTF